MRIVFLNTWHANIKDELFGFILGQASQTDIFCLQEFDKPFFDELSKKLEDFAGYYNYKEYINGWGFFQAMFIKKSLKYDFLDTANLLPRLSGAVQAIKIKKQDSDFLLCNVHGVSVPGDKNDSEERLEQSKTIIDFAKSMDMPTVIGGDFNLNPDTKSIEMFEKNGYRNLIKEYKIKITRNHFAWEQAENLQNGIREYFGKQNFADYVFVSPEIKVKSFEVLDIEVSDHLSLILDFES